jgi:hypothetical protein
VRLDHLLSKEHHEKGETSCLARAVKGLCAVVASTGCATTNFSSDVKSRAAGTLLGPETTLVLSPRLVVGCGVW